ncbi:MAG: hypothetical protein OEV87_07845 [Phycisphaerae bacterium]|nr:hypothetical protein [Phycisphaerae bacterium]
MKKVLQIINKNDLLTRGKPNLKKIQTLSLGNIVDLSNTIDKELYNSQKEQIHNQFSFSTSLELSGIGGCQGYECRLKRLDRLSRFSLMYSNKVYIPSYFSRFRDFSNEERVDVSKIQQSFYDQLRLINYIKPLVQKNLIHMHPLPHLCKSCLSDVLFQGRNLRFFDMAINSLEKDYLANLIVNASLRDKVGFVCSFPEKLPYLKCTMYKTAKHIPEPIIKRPRILSKLKSGKKVLLSKTLIRELGVHKDFINETITNVLFGMLTSQKIGSSFLTEDSIHVDFMNTLNTDNGVKRKNDLAQKYLTSLVPFIEDIQLSDLVKIRQTEGDAFLIYRQALGKAMNELKDSKSDFNVKDAKELYSDIIEPSIAKMDQRIATAKRKLAQNTYRPVLGLVGTISFGLLTGILSPQTAAIASAVGFGSCVPKMLESIMAIGDSKDSIKNEPFYFLWKVKQKGEKK